MGQLMCYVTTPASRNITILGDPVAVNQGANFKILDAEQNEDESGEAEDENILVKIMCTCQSNCMSFSNTTDIIGHLSSVPVHFQDCSFQEQCCLN